MADLEAIRRYTVLSRYYPTALAELIWSYARTEQRWLLFDMNSLKEKGVHLYVYAEIEAPSLKIAASSTIASLPAFNYAFETLPAYAISRIIQSPTLRDLFRNRQRTNMPIKELPHTLVQELFSKIQVLYADRPLQFIQDIYLKLLPIDELYQQYINLDWQPVRFA